MVEGAKRLELVGLAIRFVVDYGKDKVTNLALQSDHVYIIIGVARSQYIVQIIWGWEIKIIG